MANCQEDDSVRHAGHPRPDPLHLREVCGVSHMLVSRVTSRLPCTWPPDRLTYLVKQGYAATDRELGSAGRVVSVPRLCLRATGFRPKCFRSFICSLAGTLCARTSTAVANRLENFLMTDSKRAVRSGFGYRSYQDGHIRLFSSSRLALYTAAKLEPEQRV